MTTHIVEQGECLATIAAHHGFSWQTIYNAPENAALRRKRPNPNVLYPGDAVEIPEKRPVEARIATGRQHTFRVPRQTWEFRLRLRDHDHEPIGGVPWRLVVEGLADPLHGTTGAEGLVAVPVPPHARFATLFALGQIRRFAIGALDPVSRMTGIQQRLSRLGYDPGPVDGVLGPRTRSALLAFQQSQNDVDDTGRLDEATRLRLQEMCDEDGRELEFEDELDDPVPVDLGFDDDDDDDDTSDPLEEAEGEDDHFEATE